MPKPRNAPVQAGILVVMNLCMLKEHSRRAREPQQRTKSALVQTVNQQTSFPRFGHRHRFAVRERAEIVKHKIVQQRLELSVVNARPTLKCRILAGRHALAKLVCRHVPIGICQWLLSPGQVLLRDWQDPELPTCRHHENIQPFVPDGETAKSPTYSSTGMIAVRVSFTRSSRTSIGEVKTLVLSSIANA